MKIITSEMLAMTYNELVEYLLDKYGNVKYDYYTTLEHKSVQKKNSRTSEGLEIHHIDENKYPSLSTREFADKAPYECQKADRLVYANVLEHLLLHIKIDEEDAAIRVKNGQRLCLCNIGEIMINIRINDYFAKDSFKNWHENMAKVIRNNFDDYISELVYYLTLCSIYEPYRLLALINGVSQKWDGKINDKVLNALHEKCIDILPIKAGDKIKHKKYGKGVVEKICFFTDKFIVFDAMFEKKGLKNISSNDEFEIIKS